MYSSFDPVTLEGEPFASNITVGASPGSIINYYRTGAGVEPKTVAVYGDGVAGTVAYQRSYDSVKPVNRIYAVTRVRRIGDRTEEGPLIPIPGQNPTDVLYEGDLVTVELNAAALDDGANYLRLYRTISGLDTGETITNELDTEWHLVSELPLLAGNIMTYIDGNAATALPLDVVFSERNHPPELVARYYGLAEGGWFVAASVSGDIGISERYMHHAYPVENYLRLQGEQINDIAVFMDNVFIGTSQRPYIVAISAADKPMQAAAVPYPEIAPCLPNTMTPAPGGAIYATGQGLVALSREGMQVITRDVANAGDILYTKKLSTGSNAVAKLSNTSFGTYFQGKYYGFCEAPPIDDGFYLTTTLYPLEFFDGMQSESEFRDSVSASIIPEEITSQADFIDGELRAILITYPMPPEEDGSGLPDPGMHIKTEAEFEGGDVDTILITTEMPPDGLDISGELIGGTLVSILITTEMPSDGLDITGSLIAGTLT
jgi:hypothetical protein